MRETLLKTPVLIVLGVVILGTSLFIALRTGNLIWFSRAGSITTVLGLLLTIKHSVLSSSRNIHIVVMEKRHYANWAPGRDTEAYKQDVEYAERVIRDEYIGLGITITGTVVWGYGDILLALVAK